MQDIVDINKKIWYTKEDFLNLGVKILKKNKENNKGKHRILKAILKFILSIILMIVLFVGGFLGYSIYKNGWG